MQRRALCCSGFSDLVAQAAQVAEVVDAVGVDRRTPAAPTSDYRRHHQRNQHHHRKRRKAGCASRATPRRTPPHDSQHRDRHHDRQQATSRPDDVDRETSGGAATSIGHSWTTLSSNGFRPQVSSAVQLLWKAESPARKNRLTCQGGKKKKKKGPMPVSDPHVRRVVVHAGGANVHLVLPPPCRSAR